MIMYNGCTCICICLSICICTFTILKLLLKYYFWEIDFFTAGIKITYGILLAEEIGG